MGSWVRVLLRTLPTSQALEATPAIVWTLTLSPLGAKSNASMRSAGFSARRRSGPDSAVDLQYPARRMTAPISPDSSKISVGSAERP
jgi:hypothetical protein